MVEYNIVKFCRYCKTRFVVPKGKSMQMLCKVCEAKEKPKFPVKKVVAPKKTVKAVKKPTKK